MTDSEDEENESGFQFVNPAELLESQQRAMDQHAMLVEEFRRSVERFFDELSPDMMFTLHRMFIHAGHSNDPGMVHYWTGVTSVYLKKIHKICTKCGDKNHAEDEHMLAEAVADKKMRSDREAHGKEMLSKEWDKVLPRNETGPAGTGPSNRNLPDDALSDDELMERYNVVPAVDSELMDAVCCTGCQTVFSSLEFRQNLGKTCPTCEAQKSFGLTD